MARGLPTHSGWDWAATFYSTKEESDGGNSTSIQMVPIQWYQYPNGTSIQMVPVFKWYQYSNSINPVLAVSKWNNPLVPVSRWNSHARTSRDLRTFSHLKIIEFFAVSTFCQVCPFLPVCVFRAFVVCFKMVRSKKNLEGIETDMTCVQSCFNMFAFEHILIFLAISQLLYILTIWCLIFFPGYFLQPHLPAAAGQMSAGPISSY